jgi:uncharacterized lipoprotein YbaY
MRMLKFASALLASVIAMPALAQDSGGLSSSAISRCAGKAGTETRQADPAFGAIALDGIPWVTIERTEKRWHPVHFNHGNGHGARRRRDGTSVPFRFTCVLNSKGEALMFHTSQLLTRMRDELPPSNFVEGSATYLEKMAPPRGLELRVQLLDISKPSNVEVLTEQVLRTGWHVPIPFFLRLPKDTSFEGRKLVVDARMVLAHQTLFKLKEPRGISAADLGNSVDLTLVKLQK